MTAEQVQDRVAEVRAKQPEVTGRMAVSDARVEVWPDLSGEVGATLEAARRELWRRTIPGRFTEAALPAVRNPHDQVEVGLRDWSCNPAGRNLLLLGPVGTGKTHAGVAAVRPLFESGMEVLFRPVVELLDELRPGGPDGLVHVASYVDVLVLDDLAAERATDWTAERLYSIVNRRWLEQLPTVVTTNAEPDQLAEHLGGRMYSRLADGAVALRLSGIDRRLGR